MLLKLLDWLMLPLFTVRNLFAVIVNVLCTLSTVSRGCVSCRCREARRNVAGTTGKLRSGRSVDFVNVVTLPFLSPLQRSSRSLFLNLELFWRSAGILSVRAPLSGLQLGNLLGFELCFALLCFNASYLLAPCLR